MALQRGPKPSPERTDCFDFAAIGTAGEHAGTTSPGSPRSPPSPAELERAHSASSTQCWGEAEADRGAVFAEVIEPAARPITFKHLLTHPSGLTCGLMESTRVDAVSRAQGVDFPPSEYAWGGAASTVFWIDPQEEIVVLLLTLLMPSSTCPIRRELRTLTYQAIVA